MITGPPRILRLPKNSSVVGIFHTTLEKMGRKDRIFHTTLEKMGIPGGRQPRKKRSSLANEAPSPINERQSCN